MKKLALGIGTAALLTAAAAAPAMAQVGFYAGPFGVGVGAPAYYDCGYYGTRAATTITTAVLTSWSAAAAGVAAGGIMGGMAATPTSITGSHIQ
jgi:hypothetical protein